MTANTNLTNNDLCNRVVRRINEHIADLGCEAEALLSVAETKLAFRTYMEISVLTTIRDLVDTGAVAGEWFAPEADDEVLLVSRSEWEAVNAAWDADDDIPF